MKITSNPISTYVQNATSNIPTKPEQTNSSPFSKIEDTVEISSASLRSDNEDTVFPPVSQPIDL